MPQRVSHPTDVPMFAGLPQWVLRLGDATAECAGPRECPVARRRFVTACRPRRRRGEPTDLGGTPLRRGALWPPSGGALDAPGRVARVCIRQSCSLPTTERAMRIFPDVSNSTALGDTIFARVSFTPVRLLVSVQAE